MSRDVPEILLSGILAFVVGYLIWPPRRVYWTAVSDVVGVPVTLLLVAGVCVGVGVVVCLFASISPRNFAGGGLVAYLVGMVLIESILVPDSPVHLLLYGGVLVCLVVGVAACEPFAS
ncbi:hypothetical protein [Halorussus amylolyticus]|uniref:hypothetical protein n=1 Tax=Halorussus amylolyticus TaxID=1126242 RepID=UPI00104ADD52|nr:hypothetical protein [Halorussus amylolyticus]